MIFSSRASLRASRAPVTSAGLACENVEMIRSVAFEPSSRGAVAAGGALLGQLERDADLQVAATGQVHRDRLEGEERRRWTRAPRPRPRRSRRTGRSTRPRPRRAGRRRGSASASSCRRPSPRSPRRSLRRFSLCSWRCSLPAGGVEAGQQGVGLGRGGGQDDDVDPAVDGDRVRVGARGPAAGSRSSRSPTSAAAGTPSPARYAEHGGGAEGRQLPVRRPRAAGGDRQVVGVALDPRAGSGSSRSVGAIASRMTAPSGRRSARSASKSTWSATMCTTRPRSSISKRAAPE